MVSVLDFMRILEMKLLLLTKNVFSRVVVWLPFVKFVIVLKSS